MIGVDELGRSDDAKIVAARLVSLLVVR